MARNPEYELTFQKVPHIYFYTYTDGRPSSTTNYTHTGPAKGHWMSGYVDSDGVIPTNYSIMRLHAAGSHEDNAKSRMYGDEYQSYTSTSGSLINFPKSLCTSLSVTGTCNPGSSLGQNFISFPPGVETKLGNKLLSQIDSQVLDIGAMLAELGETANYMATRGKQLASFASKLIRRDIAGLSKMVGRSRRRLNSWKRDKELRGIRGAALTGAAWLEFNFAIRPLVGDVASLAELWQDPNEVIKRFHCRAEASESINIEASNEFTYYGENRKWNAHAKGTMKSVAVYSVTDPGAVAQQALGLANLPAAAWEAVPFSWLIDYVIGIGDFLGAQTSTAGLGYKYGYTSMSVTETREATSSRSSFNASTGEFSSQVSTGKSILEGYSRRVNYSFPRPTIEFPISDGLSAAKAANIASLGANLRSSFLKSQRRGF